MTPPGPDDINILNLPPYCGVAVDCVAGLDVDDVDTVDVGPAHALTSKIESNKIPIMMNSNFFIVPSCFFIFCLDLF
jgi:hypothetical protein